MNNISWTSNLAVQWQDFYQNAMRYAVYGKSAALSFVLQPKLPTYIDLPQTNCTAQSVPTIPPQCALASHPMLFPTLLFLPCFILYIN